MDLPFPLNRIQKLSCKVDDTTIFQYYNAISPFLLPLLTLLIGQLDLKICLAGTIVLDVPLTGSADYRTYHGLIRPRSIPLRCASSPDPLNLYHLISYLQYPDGRSIPHSSILIIDRVNHIIEYFEPYGSGTFWNESIYRFLKSELLPKFPHYRIMVPETCSISLGPQAITGSLFCVIYSLLLILLRVANPFNYQQTYQALTQLPMEQLLNLERKTICYLYSLGRQMNPQTLLRLYENIYCYMSKLIYNIDERTLILDYLKYLLDTYQKSEIEEISSRLDDPDLVDDLLIRASELME